MLMLCMVMRTQLLFVSAGDVDTEEGLEIYEEYYIDTPTEVHKQAVDYYLKERAKDPDSFNLTEESPVMRTARLYAERRLFVPPEESFTVRTKVAQTLAIDGTSSTTPSSTLGLPAPATREPADYMTAGLLSVQADSSEVMSVETASNLATALQEDISMGAIAKAGALIVEDEDGNNEGMGWISFAEKKMKRDVKLDHQSSLWFMGSQQIEMAQTNRSSINVTKQDEKLMNLKTWLEQGGGKLSFDQLEYSNNSNSHNFFASEPINEGEIVISIPLKLTMCRITSRNVLVKNRGSYLGDALKKTFEKNEVWGLAIFLLHEWFKENASNNGKGSKWGPLINSLRMRSLTTPVVNALEGTTSVEIMKRFLRDSDGLKSFSTEIDGPCGYTKGVCVTKPDEKHVNDGRFDMHHLRWAYWVVVQNAVRVKHKATGTTFLALVPFVNTLRKSVANESSVAFELDGSITIKASTDVPTGGHVKFSTGLYNDAEFFSRYYEIPDIPNPFNGIKIALPGVLQADSRINYCLKDPQILKKDECRDGSYRGEVMIWRSRVLGEWRKLMNMPPRLGDIRMWAHRLHIYGDTEEEERLLNIANQKIAGLPVSTDVMPAEEQLMLLGMARDNDEASLMLFGEDINERPAPQLYTAPDPKEDPEAQRAMENLAFLAVQLQTSLTVGSDYCNATKTVINQTRDFFHHGILPKAGLDELDQYLLKKLGMIGHCGVDKDMLIQQGGVSKELMCAMRVYLMNETEIHTFCPARIKYFEDNCQHVEFMNYTAVSLQNEISVIQAFRSTLTRMLSAFSTSIDEDKSIVKEYENKPKHKVKRGKDRKSTRSNYGPLFYHAVRLRLREKILIKSAIDYLDDYQALIYSGDVEFQLETKLKQREEEDLAEQKRIKFMEDVQLQAARQEPVAVLPVDLGENAIPGLNITIQSGDDLLGVLKDFGMKYGISQIDIKKLENALRGRIVHPEPLLLFMGVVIPTGERKVLSIKQNTNSTFETHVFCSQNNIISDDCERILRRVRQRTESPDYIRDILLVVPIDAPDGRKIKLVVREGEQHDLLQHVGDFLQLYKMDRGNTEGLANEVHRRLPPIALQIPVSLTARRQVSIRFANNDNITNVVEAFCNFYEIDSKVQLLKAARSGMAPGTFVV